MKIIPRVYPSGRKAWQVLLPRVDGKRKQPCFKTKEKAEAFLAEQKQKLARHGSLGAEIVGKEMAAIVAVREKLRAAGATIEEAAEFYLRHAARLKEELKLAELVERFRQSRRELRLSDRYVTQLGVSLGSLARFYPVKLAHEVTQANIESWLRAHGWGPKTCNNYLGDVAAMFEWAKGGGRGYVRMNPALEIERQKWVRGKIEVLPVVRAKELLQYAAEQREWRVLAHVVLGMLAGIRPAEIERLAWSAVDLEERTVIVLATDAKTAARRVVDLTPAAVAWLRLIPQELRVGEIIEPSGWVDEWTVFRRELGWDVGRKAKHLPVPVAPMRHGRWPHDAMRHTFASMHYAVHQNELLLQTQMGHRSARMLHQHYRAVVTRAEALEFWGFAPRDVGL